MLLRSGEHIHTQSNKHSPQAREGWCKRGLCKADLLKSAEGETAIAVA